MDYIESKFGASSTARDVIQGRDLTGRTVIITGGATGIGLETARALAEAGADVILAVRKPELAALAIASIETTAPGKASWRMLDLASLKSVRNFVEGWGDRPLSILVNNAGVMACPQSYTEDGFEMQIGTNHFGHYLLSVLLVPQLLRGADQFGIHSRVVAVSSGGHRLANIDLDDPDFRRTPYHRWRAYGRSKTANVLFAVAFDEYFKARGIRANSLAPGRILTPLQRHMTKQELIAHGAFDERGVLAPDMKSPEQGAATSVWAAVGDELRDQGGLYLYDGAQAPYASASNPNGVEPYALDHALAEELWEYSNHAVQAT